MNKEQVEVTIITERWINGKNRDTGSLENEVEEFSGKVKKIADKCMPRRSDNRLIGGCRK